MTNKLDEIILQKQAEVSQLKRAIADKLHHPIGEILNGKFSRNSSKNFKAALRNKSLSVIAEIKRKSPSKGHLAEIQDPQALANTYREAGANAISVLTDELFFGGNIEDLKKVALHSPLPILRKDFVIDEIQIAEAIAAGADAILCIVAALGKNTKNMLNFAKKMGIDVLVEVHDEKELDIALDSGAEIIGINNRDLTTFEIDIDRALKLVDRIPRNITRVAESGILDPMIAQAYHQAGFDAVLIGEALVKSHNPADFIEACRHD